MKNWGTDRKQKQHEFNHQTVAEAVARMKPDLEVALKAAHQLRDDDAEGDEAYAEFDRVIQLGYLADVESVLCGPSLRVLYMIADALAGQGHDKDD